MRLLSAAVEQAPVTVLVTDKAGRIEYVNQAFSQVTGYSMDEAIGQNPRMLSSGEVSREVFHDLWKAISSGNTWQGELCNRKKDGSLFWEHATVSPVKDEGGAIAHYLAVKEDITLRKEYEDRLEHQANHDQLTGLPNRVLAMDRLGQALALAGRGGKVVVVMVVILDDIGKVNDTLGFKAGDAAVIAFSQRLSRTMRQCDTLARLSGNEFLVIIGDIDTPAMAEVSAHRILEDCHQSLKIEGRDIFLTARIGMTAYPTDGRDPLVLIRNAHAATVRSEERGRNSFRFFTPKMDEEAQARLKIEGSLRNAIERNELSVFYQPIVAAGSRRLIGTEALLRWSHPELGSVSPDRFIPIAEASDLILPISDWVLRQACRDASRWQAKMGIFKLAVNFSPRQFRSLDLVEKILDILEEEGFPKECLEVEVTERLLMSGMNNAKIILDTIKSFDISLSIDDFGTGYSSLGYLQNFQFDTLKIDRSFVKEVDGAEASRSLASAIIEMARALHMEVVAEGVETVEQERILGELGCQAMQGYLFGRPMPANEFDVLIGL
ncbi:EAL domain-containing protein [Telmatospirillum sp.]|uniref:putative bifunctional diguanylate cyclase/phosphodiesterase n=1 Tax=Telmatospirillum sp. TaxID=2079197 RepID=UPI002842B49F|nr:EAL domain-containing protein [Telmatospirillum sp.]MDR3437462.1 EAL domain-containing protein [Telmatospirillum sp.]